MPDSYDWLTPEEIADEASQACIVREDIMGVKSFDLTN
jgi:hypothetical protein